MEGIPTELSAVHVMRLFSMHATVMLTSALGCSRRILFTGGHAQEGAGMHCGLLLSSGLHYTDPKVLGMARLVLHSIALR